MTSAAVIRSHIISPARFLFFGKESAIVYRALITFRGRLSKMYKHRHAKRARVIFFGDRSIRRTVHSNDLVKVWVATYSKKETGNL